MQICQILHVIFESKIQFSFKFCIDLQCHQTSPLYYFRSNIRFFGQRRQLKSKFFRFSILKWQVNSFSNFASFFAVMTHNSSVNFKPVHVLLWTKGPLQSPNFETFESFGENLLNSWCHFSNHKSVFLQIIHHFSESWNIIPLYFLSSNIIYVGQKEPI